jgi:hypothetical protein
MSSSGVHSTVGSQPRSIQTSSIARRMAALAMWVQFQVTFLIVGGAARFVNDPYAVVERERLPADSHDATAPVA